jgi:predicted DCC family thiol-disulfide oxidoreductase YuxK
MSKETKVIYNASCSVCSYEINAYQRYAQEHDLPVGFDDLNQTDLSQFGLTRDQAARRLYVIHNDQMIGGIPAFIALWSEMPRYRWLARVVSVPGIRHFSAFMYDYVLAPLVYAAHRRRDTKRSGQDGNSSLG